MESVWVNPSVIAAESLMLLQKALVITPLCGVDKTSDFLITPNGYKVGKSVNIETGPDYTVDEFTGEIRKQKVRESERPLMIQKHFDISVEITAQEKKLNLDSFSEKVLRPAVYKMAEKCDAYVGEKILEAAGLYASQNLFTTKRDMALARKAANLQHLNPDSRLCLVDTDLETELLAADYFSSYEHRGDAGAQTFNSGFMQRAMGMDFYASLNFPSDAHSAGNRTTITNNVNGTKNLIGDKILQVDASAGAVSFKANDRIQIAGVKTPLKVAKNTAGTAQTVELIDPITEIIPDNAAVTVIGSGWGNMQARGVIMDSAAIGFASPVLDPASDKPTAIVSDSGFSMRVVQGYDQAKKAEVMSIDMLAGATAYDPRRMTLLRNR